MSNCKIATIALLRDSISIGLFSGMAGNLAKGILNLLTWKSKRQEALYSHLAGSMFLKRRRIKKKGSLFVGSLADFTTGTLLGIPLVYLLKKTGKDNYMVKGAGFGMFLWGLLYGAGHNLGLFLIKPQKYKSGLWAFFEHITYGMVTAYTAVSFAEPGTFPDKEYDFENKKFDY